MDCSYSDPVNYQGNLPSSSLEAFQFRHSTCSTPSAVLNTQTQTSTQSAVSFTPEVNQAIMNQNFMFFFGIVLILLALGILTAWTLLRDKLL